jgi:uncharacterized peroxidase-related enzyme
MVEYAVKLAKSPALMVQDDVTKLRDAGLSDLGIHDLVNCVAYFAYANRVVAGLGVVPGGKEGAVGQ